MKIAFLGTRGYIDAKNQRHYRHTAALVSYKGRHVMIDCGLDWRNKVFEVSPDALVITHAHPDHAWGLKKQGSPCPVFTTRSIWSDMECCSITIENDKKNVLAKRQQKTIQGITFQAFPVVHSVRVSAVGYRITAGRNTIFYVPDLVEIQDQNHALSGIDLYIGDGASISRPIIRTKDDKRFGHASIQMQLDWCQQEKVPRAIFTHCGSQIVEGDERTLGPKVERMGRERGIVASIAHDGDTVVL